MGGCRSQYIVTWPQLVAYHSVREKSCLCKQNSYIKEVERVRTQPAALPALTGLLYFLCISINSSIFKEDSRQSDDVNMMSLGVYK